MLIGGAATIVGAWLRQIVQVYPNFNIVFLGTIICSWAQVFFINTGSKLATNWFGDNEVTRVKSKFIESFGNCVWWIGITDRMCYGVCGSSILHKQWGRLAWQFHQLSFDSEHYGYPIMYPHPYFCQRKTSHSTLVISSYLLCSQSANKDDEKLDFNKELKALLRNKSYLFLSGTFTFLYGIYTSLGAVVSSVT